jgi:diguanylate cyclase (GGDEF)-like protein
MSSKPRPLVAVCSALSAGKAAKLESYPRQSMNPIMKDSFGDGRFEEVQFLAEIGRRRFISLEAPLSKPARDMITFLISEGHVADPGMRWSHSEDHQFAGLLGESELERRVNASRLRLLSRHLGEQQITLELTHKGRVRLSQLKQDLQSRREREPFGILWDARHWEQDLQIAILDATENTPLTIAYCDMNGLKQINDNQGHDAGDQALRTYFEALSSALGDRGQAYRLSGGADEVLVVLPHCNESTALQLLRVACTKLMNERPKDQESVLSMAVGIISTSDPAAIPTKLRAAADEQQKRAKQKSKESSPRPSVIAAGKKDELITIER